MGMPEYRDGSFGSIKPVDESLRDLLENPVEQERTKALHIGTFQELEQRLAALTVSDEPDCSEDSEPLVEILKGELRELRIDVNKIMAHLGIRKTGKILYTAVPPEE